MAKTSRLTEQGWEVGMTPAQAAEFDQKKAAADAKAKKCAEETARTAQEKPADLTGKKDNGSNEGTSNG